MTIRNLLLISAALFGTVGCTQAEEATSASPASLPTTVNCAEAPTLNVAAADARRHLSEQTGDRAKIISGNRARFLASLAAVAELRCKVAAREADGLLQKALELGRVAEAAQSEYAAARRWTEADLVAAEAIALLIGQLPAPPSR